MKKNVTLYNVRHTYLSLKSSSLGNAILKLFIPINIQNMEP